MYILSQDKNRILFFGGSENTDILEVSRNLGGGKDKKFIVNTNGIALGAYAEEKNALDELSRIMDALEDGKTTYRIR